MLETEKINATCEMSTVMKDLCSNTFCVPVIYKHSPLAYSIVNEIHWHSDAAEHSDVETVWRYVFKLKYIMQGRDLVKKVKKNCERYLSKKAINNCSIFDLLDFRFVGFVGYPKFLEFV